MEPELHIAIARSPAFLRPLNYLPTSCPDGFLCYAFILEQSQLLFWSQRSVHSSLYSLVPGDLGSLSWEWKEGEEEPLGQLQCGCLASSGRLAPSRASNTDSLLRSTLMPGRLPDV